MNIVRVVSRLRGIAIACSVGMLLAMPATRAEPAVEDVLKTYANIAHAGYEDSLITAKKLKKAVDALFAAPNAKSLKAAKAAWIAARVPYQQTEVYRFGNTIVDDWEGKVNAWPLDEGLIDYVQGDYGTESEENELYTANVIANSTIKINGQNVDASKITKTLIAETLHEAGGIEANVASGYHAIEFLLWGQDLYGTDKGAGARPATDFDPKNCTGGNCERRRAYLEAATDLLIDDLEWMVKQWAEGGDARSAILGGSDTQGIVAMVTGMGSLSYGELAGERMKLGLLLHEPEEEHDCFSDNTHASHYYDALGIKNVYLGSYKRIDGTMVRGPSLSDLVKAKDQSRDVAMRKAFDQTMKAMSEIKARAEGGEAYDQMIGEGNEEGNVVIQMAIDRLIAQTRELERVISTLGITAVKFEDSDSLDRPVAVQ